MLLIQEEIDGGDGGREQHAADLVEGDGGVGEGEVLQYHVQTHGAGQWQHFEDFGAFGLEESEGWSGEGVEEYGGHEEVVGCKAELGVFEQGICEEGLVGEDLGIGQ